MTTNVPTVTFTPMGFVETAAKSVPDVESVRVFIAIITRDRVVAGQVQITGPGKQTAAASFGSFLTGIVDS